MRRVPAVDVLEKPTAETQRGTESAEKKPKAATKNAVNTEFMEIQVEAHKRV